jgi:RHS repeat-associated protein
MRKFSIFLFFILHHSNAQTVSTDKNAVIHSQFRTATTNPADGSNPDKAAITIQYSDGLGRPLQTIGYQQSPTKKDIVSGAVEYDMYGRSIKTALTAPTTSSSGGFQSNPTGLANSFYGDANSFSSITNFDNSPLNRTRVKVGPGQDWQNNNKNIQTYDGAAGSDIRYYRLDVNKNIIFMGVYPANSLYKKHTIDEQGHSFLEIIDKRGRTVEKQQQDDTGFIITHFIYDPLGRILAVIQPEGYKLNASIYKGTTEWNNYVFAYEYDYRGRMHLKHVPNGGDEYMVYDKYDRLVLSQSAQQRQILPGESYPLWTFYKYDALDREIMRGEFNDNATLAQVEAYVNANVTSRTADARSAIAPLYYSLNASYPNWVTAANIRQVTYYDDYNTWLPAGMGFDAANAFNAGSYWSNAKGDVVGSRTKKTENGAWLASVIYRDTKGRVLQTLAQNAFEQIERTDFQYNFAGEVVQIKSIHKNASNVAIATEITQNQHDHVGRLLNIAHGINTAPTEMVRLSYDEIGRMMRKKILPNGNYLVGGTKDYIIRPSTDGAVSQNNTQDIAKKAVILQPTTDLKALTLNAYTASINPNAATGISISGLQTIDYSYHIRGGLLGINLDASKNPIPKTTEGDLFSYKLDYQSAGYWDGNIGKQTWATQNASTNALETRNYIYNYDAPSRLKSAAYAGVGNEDFSIPNMNYDKNGNITNLQRNGKIGNTFGMMDNLNYGYTGNQLNYVVDNVSGNNGVDFVQRGGANYTYWNDGSLKSDANEQISLILYDSFLRQPKEIQLTDGRWIKHYYDGAGTLLKTIYYTATNTILETWDFVGNMIYKNGVPYQMNTPEGRAIYQNSVWTYEFDYKDHLGNTRVSFKANGSNLEKTAETAFDPWGVRLNIGAVNAYQNRFEMQGKESERTFGLNRVNFGNRIQNPTIGRFDRIDLFADKYTSLSSYQFTANNPINLIDINGDSLDFSELLKSSIHSKALSLFASSKLGSAWLSNYAAKGQKLIVDGKTIFEAKKDGVYHTKGINIGLGLNNEKTKSSTFANDNIKGTLNISIDIANEGSGSGNRLFDLTKAITHELFVHAEIDTKDYLDDKKINESNLGAYKGLIGHSQHYYVSRKFAANKLSPNDSWPNSATRILVGASSTIGLKLTVNQINNIMWNFRGSLVNIDATNGKMTEQK